MSEVEDLLNQIKESWPKFVITKENLTKPTQELVVRFYNNFISEYNEKVAYLTGGPVIFGFNAADYEPEEQLFLQLSKLLGRIGGLKFTLADIYQPTPVRTKNFFKICIHFAAFTEYLQNETEALGNKVFTTKEDTIKLSLEQERLIHEINENAKKKNELTERKNLLEQECKSVRNAHKEIKALRAVKEKLYAEKRNQIENHKRELHNEEYELKQLESVEKDLLEQRITEKEHQHILHTVSILKSESEILDNHDIDIGDGLELENKVLQHSAQCVMILNKCDFNVTNVKTLINKEDELKVVSNTVDKLVSSKLHPIKQQKSEHEQKLITLKQQLGNLQSEYKIVKDTYLTNLNQFSQEINKLKDGIEDKSKKNSKIISDYNKDIERLEKDMDKLRKSFTTEYIRVSKVEKVVVDKFKETLMKFKDIE